MWQETKLILKKITGLCAILILVSACVPKEVDQTPLRLTYAPTLTEKAETCADTRRLGCANAINLQKMLANQDDLKAPNEMDMADGEATTLSIQRYRAGETTELSDSIISELGQ